MLLLYTIAELSLLCGIRSESGSVCARHSTFFILLGTAVFLLAIWQNVIAESTLRCCTPGWLCRGKDSSGNNSGSFSFPDGTPARCDP